MKTKDNTLATCCPPCKAACPILTDARGYIQLIAERKYEEAFVSIRKLNPLPRVCGRICTHPCEAACKRGQVEGPIAIAALKRFASDGPWAGGYKAALPQTSSGQKVAVVGSGPAGLAAAHDLALLGYAVTIFEALPVLGGMLRVGVPAYRLPQAVLEDEIRAILSLGIQVKTGVRVGAQIQLADLFDQGYKAVFLAVGAHEDRKLGIAGEDDLEGVASAVAFLRKVNQGQHPKVGANVAVIGGGNTAVDSARSALRLGARQVHMLYRRSLEEMTAAREEIEEAIHEGVHVAYLTSPVEVVGDGGKVSGVKCVRNDLGESDASGRRSPIPVPGSEFTLNVDMVIVAIGQAPESSFLEKDVEISGRGKRIVAKNRDTLATSHPGVFAGGDAVTGPATAVAAIAAGKKAAWGIDLYLKEKSELLVESGREAEPQRISGPVIEKTAKFSRTQGTSLPVSNRLRGFDEVVSVFSEDLAIREALRCLHCCLGARVNQEKCISCLTCVRVCPLHIPKVSKMGEISIDPFDCQACGICALECPVQAIDITLHPQDSIVQKTEELISKSPRLDPLIVGFFDLYGNFRSQDVEDLKENYRNIVPVMVFGLRRIDTWHILKAFEFGADAVLLAPCPKERDPFLETRGRVERCLTHAKAIARVLDLAPERLAMWEMPEQGLIRSGVVDEALEKIKELGPSPLRG